MENVEDTFAEGILWWFWHSKEFCKIWLKSYIQAVTEKLKAVTNLPWSYLSTMQNVSCHSCIAGCELQYIIYLIMVKAYYKYNFDARHQYWEAQVKSIWKSER